MGRSTTSCFKIIACGSDSAEQEGIEPSESKGSSDKRGWSFRKRSARHRVLSNTVVSEMPSSVNKEIPESTTINLQDQSSGTFTEKTSTVPWIEEKPQSPSVVPKVCNTIVASKDENLEDVSPDESVIVVIQTAIRGFLAQRELLKVKNIVKLQAAVRGHLVRRHAVGTLRCVQAIVKMQALVRARIARLSSEEKFDGKHTKDNRSSNFSDKGNSVTKPLVTYTSIEKLLSNKFANQLMESTPRTKSIHIKCDPSSRSDSAWNWLERWMSVSSTGAELKQKPESKVEQVEQDKIEDSSTKEEIGSPTEGYESTDLKANTTEAVVPFKTDQDSMTSDSASPPSSSSASENLDAAQHESLGPSITKQKSSELLSDQIKHSDSSSQMEFKSVSSNSEMETEPSNKSVKRAAPEEVETEGKRFAFGTRKATNPAFIAVQSKFEELSTTPSSARSTSSQKQTFGGELNSDAISSSIDNEITTRETDLVENSVSHSATVKVGGSECGTELSITSTLDSSDRFEIGGMDVEKETELKELGSSNSNRSKDLDNEANGETASGLDFSYSVSVQPERHDNVDVANEKSANSVTTVSSFQEKQNLETNASSENIELGTETGHQSSKSSREASPRSHMTIPEFQGTPSSQVSIKAKRSRSERGSSNQKHRASSAGKASPSNPNHNSGSKSSLEPIPKDHKTGKRRNSFGSGRSDYVDQEPRDSSSSNSLPSYMQATESARAKALANSSPRSSPDVQEKEIYIKKRHSLPGANGKQGSPRVQQSKPQAHQSAKGNGHPHERKWQR